MQEPRRVVFLDRDGTINLDFGYVHKEEDWEFVEYAPDALKILREQGYLLAIVTNQSGIADGKYREKDVEKLHAHRLELLEQQGVSIDSVALCPHSRISNCECRKPRTGLAKKVEVEIGPIDYPNSWVVGDKDSDIGFGKKIGTRTALIKSRYWRPEELNWKPDGVYDSLYDFASKL